MKRTQSKQKSSLIKTKKDDNEYAEFLEKKLEEEQYLAHLVNNDVKTLEQENQELKQLVAKLRTSDKKSTKKIAELEQDKEKQQEIITKLQEQTTYLTKKAERIQSEHEKEVNPTEPLETKIVFKQFLSKTFPTYKDTIKRILRFFMYIEKYEQSGKEERIKTYNEFVKSIVEKIMLFIFPKKSENEKNNSIALTMVEKWRSSESEIEKLLRRELMEMKNLNTEYLSKIEAYEAEMLRLRAAKNMLESKVQMYEKTLKVKASEFVVHFKKALIKKTEYGEEDEAIEQMKEIMKTLEEVVHMSGGHGNNELAKDNTSAGNNNKISPNELITLSNKSLPNIDLPQESSKKQLKKHPILKKNIYGYYEEPQLSTQWNFLTSTKHPDLNKYTQTLPDDLTILVTHPVIAVHLFDGDIRPQRARHNMEFYVRIHKNSEASISSPSIESTDYKPVWNRQYLIKSYDFPSLRIELLNKSKGLRDKVLGEGRLTVESSESKIVPIRKEKEYQGRVRFGLHYPKGNIFEFVINSIQLILPEHTKILTETIEISAEMNESITEKFTNSQLTKYLTNYNKSIIIIQGVEGVIEGRVLNRKLSGNVSSNEFTEKEGSKRVVINVDDGWQIVLEGYIVLIVSEENEPERIEFVKEEKYFVVRAGYPLVSATYGYETLYSHVKLPLVFNYKETVTSLKCVFESENNVNEKTEEMIIDPLIVPGTENILRTHELLSTPPHIYQFFISTIEGPEVKFAYQSLLFVKLPEKIKLEIEIDQNNFFKEVSSLDPFMKKGKRKLAENETEKIEFFIEIKDLMMNFYKILSKTYKVTGYSKFKLGYCKVKNLLVGEGQEKGKKEEQQKSEIIPKQLPTAIGQLLQNEYYINICISKGYLPTFPSTSKYAIELLNEENNYSSRTELMKGEMLEWEHEMLVKFRFKEFEQTEEKEENQGAFFTIRVIESPMIIGGEKIVYECRLPMSKNVLKLGRIVLNLSEEEKVESLQKQFKEHESLPITNQSLVILSKITIPLTVYSVYIDRIELEVEEQADWLTNIDPYVVFIANDREIYRTSTIDGAGDNAEWNNLEFSYVVKGPTVTKTTKTTINDQSITIADEHNNSKEKQQNSKQTILQLRIYDEDLIKSDDYLGLSNIEFDESFITNKENNEINCIRSNVVKENKVCGSVKIYGRFRKIVQSTERFITETKNKSDNSIEYLRSQKHGVFNICLTDIRLFTQEINKVLEQEEMNNSNINSKLSLAYYDEKDSKSVTKEVDFLSKHTGYNNQSLSITTKTTEQEFTELKDINFTIFNKLINLKEEKREKSSIKQGSNKRVESNANDDDDDNKNSIRIDLYTRRKRLFKSEETVLIGTVDISLEMIKELTTITTLQLPINSIITNEELQEKHPTLAMGTATILIQPIYSTLYSIIDTYTSGMPIVKLSSIREKDNDIIIRPTTKYYLNPLIDHFKGLYLFGEQNEYVVNDSFKAKGEEKGVVRLKLSEESNAIESSSNVHSNLRQVSYYSEQNPTHPLNNIPLAYYKINNNNNLLHYIRQFINPTNNNNLSPPLSISSENNKNINNNHFSSLYPKLYKIKILHWEPILFEPLKEFEIEIKFGNNGKCVVKKRLNEIFNWYYVINGDEEVNKMSSLLEQQKQLYQEQQLIFPHYLLPQELTIMINKESKQTNKTNSSSFKESFTIPLIEQSQHIELEKHTYYENRGAFYYELEQFKGRCKRVFLKRLLIVYEGDGDYLKEQEFPYISISGSPLTYQPIKHIGDRGYYFENIEFYIPVDSNDKKNNTITNEVNLKFTFFINNKNNNETITKELQIPLIHQSNQPLDYIYDKTEQYTLHAEVIVEEDTRDIMQPLISPAPQLPTEISFIELQQLTITPTEELHNSSEQLKIKFSLHNQYIEMKATLERSEEQSEEHISYSITESELLYLYLSKPSIIKIELLQERLFGGDILIGYVLMEIKQHELMFGESKLIGEIKSYGNNSTTILGRVEIRYKPLSEVKFLYVDVDKVVPNREYKELTVELIPVGKEKKKYQRVILRLENINNLLNANLNKNNNDIQNYLNYNTTEDLIISEHDYQDYVIHISNTETNELLAKFKLCDLIKQNNGNDYEYVDVIHPLRVVKEKLNGLLRVNYIESVSGKIENLKKEEKFNKGNKGELQKEQVVTLSMTEFKFINQEKEPYMSVVIQKSSGKLMTEELKFSNTTESNKSESTIRLIIHKDERLIIFLRKHVKEQSQPVSVAFANVDLEVFMRENKELMMFQSYLEPSIVYGLCRISITKSSEEITNENRNNFDKKVFYEIREIKANNLTDMELLTKMNPYIMMEPSIKNNKNKYITKFLTEVNEGKTNLWWKVGLIFEDSIKLTLYDRDIKYDDYIGETMITKQQLEQQLKSIIKTNEQQHNSNLNQELSLELQLLSTEQDNKPSTGQVSVILKRIEEELLSLEEIGKEEKQEKELELEEELYCLLIDGWCGCGNIYNLNNSNVNNVKENNHSTTSTIQSFIISLSDGTVLYSLSNHQQQLEQQQQQEQLHEQLNDHYYYNTIDNILRVKPILLKDYPFFITKKSKKDSISNNNNNNNEINRNNNNNNHLLFIDVETKTSIEGQSTTTVNQSSPEYKRFQQVINLEELLESNNNNLEHKMIKHNLISDNIQEHQLEQMFSNCRLVPLRDVLLMEERRLQSIGTIHEQQQQQLELELNNKNRETTVLTLDSLTLWLLYGQDLLRKSSLNILTIRIVITIKENNNNKYNLNNNNNNKNNNSIYHTPPRLYILNLQSPPQPKLLKSTKESCITIDLKQSLQYKIYLEPEDELIQVYVSQEETLIATSVIDLVKDDKENGVKEDNKGTHNFINTSSLLLLTSHKLYLSSRLGNENEEELNMNMKMGEVYLTYTKKEVDNSICQSKNMSLIKELDLLKNNKPSSELKWLEFILYSATFYKDIETFSKMDPYCIVEFNQSLSSSQSLKESSSLEQTNKQEHRFTTKENIGTNPVWDETVFFEYFTTKENKGKEQEQQQQNRLTKREEILLKFMDEEVVKDRPLGEVKVNVESERLLSECIKQLDKSEKQELTIYSSINDDKNNNEKLGTAIISYHITTRYIIFTNIYPIVFSNTNIENKFMIRKIANVKELKNKNCEINRNEIKELERERLILIKPYPIGNTINKLEICCGKEIKYVQINDLIPESLYDQNEYTLWFDKHLITINYIIFT